MERMFETQPPEVGGTLERVEQLRRGLRLEYATLGSLVVVWHLKDVATRREQVALRLIRLAFVGLAVYLSIQAAYALATHATSVRSPVGIGWLSATFVAMLLLAGAKARTGAALGNAVLSSEALVIVVYAVKEAMALSTEDA
jgi:hypothetical protein